MKILVLLESPSKIVKIQHFLEEAFPENEYTVLASGGHINRIADKGTWGLGIDLETMTPDFALDRTKSKNITAIKKAGKAADLIVLASDPDREGEAISYHLANLFEQDPNKIKRATFNEITKEAVIDAFNNLRDLDQDLINAQVTRQMLDKIIGYLVSKSLQKTTGLMSAGRVQTPALNILVTRDKLIKQFKEVKYQKISVVDKKNNILLTLNKGLDKKVVNTEKTGYITSSQAQEIINTLDTNYQCVEYKGNEFETRSFKPYSTASLLQDGFSKLRLSASQISIAAQKLYENGLVTYIRTDSNRYSEAFVKDAKNYINTNFENNLFKDIVIVKKDANAQDAHESIRPTDLKATPEQIQIEDETQKRLYSLIWWNTVKSLMRGPSGINHRWTLMNNNYEFKQSWQEVKDLGYQGIKKDNLDENVEMDDNEEVIEQVTDSAPKGFTFNDKFSVEISKDKIINEDAKTMPPKMFNQASLIKELKNLGIGRPSTYNPTLSTLKEREYTIYHKGKAIEVTDKGYTANDYLYQGFPHLFDLGYTAQMETKLDEIANGKDNGKDWLKEIYSELNEKVKVENEKAKTSDLPCPRCKIGTLVFIKSKFGRGRGCSNFTTTGCGYREYEQPDGSWKEYLEPTPEEKAARAEARKKFLEDRKKAFEERKNKKTKKEQ
ncbi:DNA topoisomerase I [Williamsoniiplasma somnilux]|uniref:DNA topoisomerase 1 n=1 Tax=Williamsoniiplasma somnilux TaxID=215578 RepID=A0A2K8NXA3_9MOLU|nr:type IA DNA topoisomerase [Williamsoniiplasma somnilux]ATZ18472.1 DNA topoisomerase I [Williamsoniiplasma somnilux]